MNIKELREEMEKFIAEKGIGSGKLARAERIQRDINIAVLVGAAATILGITAYTIYKYKGE